MEKFHPIFTQMKSVISTIICFEYLEESKTYVMQFTKWGLDIVLISFINFEQENDILILKPSRTVPMISGAIYYTKIEMFYISWGILYLLHRISGIS